MLPDTYYVVGTGIGLLTIGWAVFLYLRSEDKEVVTRLDGHVDMHARQLDTLRTTVETRYADTVLKLAAVSEQLTNEKIERIQDNRDYVSRAEFDRRFERVEDALHIQDTKIDEVLRHVSGLPRSAR